MTWVLSVSRDVLWRCSFSLEFLSLPNIKRIAVFGNFHFSITSMSQQQNQEDLYLQSYPFTTAAAIIGSVDKKVFLMLYDGRTVIGVLRSFDQFGNLIIHDAQERLYYADTKQWAESPLETVVLIRGENLVMMGELDIDKEDDIMGDDWTQVDYKQALERWSQPRDLAKEEELNEKYKQLGLEKPQTLSF